MFNLLLFQLNFIIPPIYILDSHLKTNVGPINFCPPSNLCVFISNMKYDNTTFIFVCLYHSNIYIPLHTTVSYFLLIKIGVSILLSAVFAFTFKVLVNPKFVLLIVFGVKGIFVFVVFNVIVGFWIGF